VKTLRVVAYAINGRGMGHLVRQIAILRWVRRYAAAMGVKLEAWILTSSEADTLARREGFLSLKIPSKSMMRDAGVDPARYLAIARSWVLQTVVGLAPDLLVVDTFPAGSFGEMVNVLELVPARALVARPVRPEVEREDAYRALLPLYGKVIVPDVGGVGPILLREPEELPTRAEARAALGLRDGERAVWVSLGGGGDPVAAGTLPRLVDLLRGRGWQVVVGAGPLYQGPERRGEGVVWLDRYAGVELLPGVDAAVSAGGYNSWHELMGCGVPTVFLPQPRIADDQEGRAERAVAAGAGRVVAHLHEVPDALDALLAEPGAPDAARALVWGSLDSPKASRSGAARAAVALLEMVLPPRDVQHAAAAFPAALLGHPIARALPTADLIELVRHLGGEVPSRWRERAAAGLELVDAGHLHGEVPSDGPRGAPVLDTLDRVAATGLPISAIVPVIGALARRWPAAGGRALSAALATLLPALAPYDDAAGAISLLRALPSPRAWSLGAAATELAGWLDAWRAGGGDLFDAQRALLRADPGGQRGLSETLRLLRVQAPPAEESLL
jgi:hypothetical protein